MRVFNASRTQQYAHHELNIGPGFTDVPPDREEGVRGLIKKYPHHLSEGGTAPAELQLKTELIATQATRIKELEGQVAKLQILVGGADATEAQKADAILRATTAEGSLAAAQETIGTQRSRIFELESQLTTASGEIVSLREAAAKAAPEAAKPAPAKTAAAAKK